MDNPLLAILTAFGLGLSSGLNASLPLFLIGLADRSGAIDLAPPFDLLGDPVTLAIMGTLAALEFVVDKSTFAPLLHKIQTPVVLAAGGIVAGTQTQAVDSVHPAVLLGIGLLTTAGTHGARVSARKALGPVRGTSVGNGLSWAKDLTVLTLTGSALISPWLAVAEVGVLIILFVILCVFSGVIVKRLIRWITDPLLGRRPPKSGSPSQAERTVVPAAPAAVATAAWERPATNPQSGSSLGHDPWWEEEFTLVPRPAVENASTPGDPFLDDPAAAPPVPAARASRRRRPTRPVAARDPYPS